MRTARLHIVPGGRGGVVTMSQGGGAVVTMSRGEGGVVPCPRGGGVVTMCWGGCCDHVPGGGRCCPEAFGVATPPPTPHLTEWVTHACKNITFARFATQAVKTAMETRMHSSRMCTDGGSSHLGGGGGGGRNCLLFLSLSDQTPLTRPLPLTRQGCQPPSRFNLFHLLTIFGKIPPPYKR